MNLREEINEKYKTSIKSKNIIEIDTLRLIRSAIKDKDIENRVSNDSAQIDNQQILSLLQSLVKQRKDSIESFKLGARNDLLAQEEKEIEIITQFLPATYVNDFCVFHTLKKLPYCIIFFIFNDGCIKQPSKTHNTNFSIF